MVLIFWNGSSLSNNSLKSRVKMGYKFGAIAEPEEIDPKDAMWDAENSTVMSWLLNLILPEISRRLRLLPTTKEIWHSVNQIYSKIGVAAQIYEPKVQIHWTEQGTMTINQYYNTMRSLWLELDLYQTVEMESAADSVKLKNFLGFERLFEFLAGLNLELDQVRGQVLSREPFPSLKEAHAYVKGEDSRRIMMLLNSSTENLIVTAPNNSALLASNSILGVPKTEGRKPLDRDGLWCDYCHNSRHTRDKCWKLHGKPQNIQKMESQQLEVHRLIMWQP